MRDVVVLSDPPARAVLDARALPAVLVVFWCGPVTPKLAHDYFDRLAAYERARDDSKKYVVVTDTTRAEVSAAARKAVAELSERSKPDQQRHRAADVVVIDNAVMRGAITAIDWLTRGGLGITPVRDLDEAFRTAATLLLPSGQRLPPRMLEGGYRPPDAVPPKTAR